jgi:hypothetical protein
MSADQDPGLPQPLTYRLARLLIAVVVLVGAVTLAVRELVTGSATRFALHLGLAIWAAVRHGIHLP